MSLTVHHLSLYPLKGINATEGMQMKIQDKDIKRKEELLLTFLIFGSLSKIFVTLN